MIGQRFTVAKRRVAMFCVALCMGLSAQVTMVVLDRAKHTFQIDHAPNGLAGPVFEHGHHLSVDVQHSPDQRHEDDHHAAVGHHDHDGQRVADHGHTHGDDAAPGHGHVHAHNEVGATGSTHHTHDWLPQGHDHGPITHHHHGSGMLSPWLVSAPPQIAILPVRVTVLDYGVTGHPDAPAWRRDRPPKLNLERIV